jgi:excisionase family DNA binding protein
MPKPPPPDLITSSEVCDLLSIDRSTLSRWVKEGRITPVMKLPGLRGGFVFDRNTIPVPKRAS